MLSFPSSFSTRFSSVISSHQTLYRTLNRLLTAWVVQHSATPQKTLEGLHWQHQQLKRLEVEKTQLVKKKNELILSQFMQDLTVSHPKPKSGKELAASPLLQVMIKLEENLIQRSACMILQSSDESKPPFRLYAYQDVISDDDIPPLKGAFTDLNLHLEKSLKAFKQAAMHDFNDFISRQETHDTLQKFFFAFDTISQAQKDGTLTKENLRLLKKISSICLLTCMKLAEMFKQDTAGTMDSLEALYNITRYMLARIACFHIGKEESDFDLLLADSYLQDCEKITELKRQESPTFKPHYQNIRSVVKARLALAEQDEKQFELFFTQIEITHHTFYPYFRLLQVAGKHFSLKDPSKAIKYYEDALAMLEREPQLKDKFKQQRENILHAIINLKSSLLKPPASVEPQFDKPQQQSTLEKAPVSPQTLSSSSLSPSKNKRKKEKKQAKSLSRAVPSQLIPMTAKATDSSVLWSSDFKFSINRPVTPIYSSKCAQAKGKAKMFVYWEGIPKADNTVEKAFEQMLNPTREGLLLVGLENQHGPKIMENPDRLGEKWPFCGLRFKRENKFGWARVKALPVEKVAIKNEDGTTENRYLFKLGKIFSK